LEFERRSNKYFKIGMEICFGTVNRGVPGIIFEKQRANRTLPVAFRRYRPMRLSFNIPGGGGSGSSSNHELCLIICS
jgi:hypothetical protein